MLPGRHSVRHASCSTAGRRAIKEDRAATLQLDRQTCVIAVADGMGGMAAGEVASNVAMTAFLESVRASVGMSPRHALRTAFAAADEAVRTAVIEGREGMGTTLTAAIVRDGEVWVGNVGDSRAVLVLSDEVVSLSRDHSMIAEAVRNGHMTELEALQSPERHVISRALGEGDAAPDIQYRSLQRQGEPMRATLLAGSDGLFNFIGETEILEIACGDTRPSALVESLVRRAIENGSDDNVSAAAVSLGVARERSKWAVRAVAALILLIALASAAYPLRRDILHAAASLGALGARDRPETVRLPRAHHPHLRAGDSGKLCVPEGECIGTWSVVDVNADSVVVEIRSTRRASGPGRGGR